MTIAGKSIDYKTVINLLREQNKETKPSFSVTETESREVTSEFKVNLNDQRDSIVNDLLKDISIAISEEQKDLRRHRIKAIKYLSIFLSIVTIAVFTLLYIMILLEKGETSVRLSLIAAVFADTLGLVYIVFRYLFADAHKNHDEVKDILKIYSESKD